MKPSRSSISVVAACLRTLSLEAEPGALLGSEEALVATLGAARATVRQAARILEFEGLLLVRRGSSGGYFAARPDAETIETAVGAYLDTLDIDIRDVGVVAAMLWSEVMRKACALRSPASAEVAKGLRARIARVRPTIAFRQVIEIEHDFRTAIFDLTGARYIELIFQINYAFAQRRAMPDDSLVTRPTDADFVRRWRESKLMELQAIADGDVEMGVMAAAYGRNIWRQRFSSVIGFA